MAVTLQFTQKLSPDRIIYLSLTSSPLRAPCSAKNIEISLSLVGQTKTPDVHCALCDINIGMNINLIQIGSKKGT